MEKLIKDITNKDLYEAGFPDSVGSFMNAFLEEKLHLHPEDYKNKPFSFFKTKYKEWKNSNQK
jgi:hypothetical protein